MAGSARRGLAAAFLFLGSLGLPLLASAAFVQVETSGSLARTHGTDELGLDGSLMTFTVVYDTEAAPYLDGVNGTVAYAHYWPSSATVSFTNRAGGAPDLLFGFAGDEPPLTTINDFSGSTDDHLWITSRFVTIDGTAVAIPFQHIYFSQDFFPGSASAPLPGFTAADVSLVQAGGLSTENGAVYSLSSLGVATKVVPVPAAVWLFGSALGAVAVVRRRRSPVTRRS